MGIYIMNLVLVLQIFFQFTSFLTPGIVYSYDLTDAEAKPKVKLGGKNYFYFLPSYFIPLCSHQLPFKGHICGNSKVIVSRKLIIKTKVLIIYYQSAFFFPLYNVCAIDQYDNAFGLIHAFSDCIPNESERLGPVQLRGKANFLPQQGWHQSSDVYIAQKGYIYSCNDSKIVII